MLPCDLVCELGGEKLLQTWMVKTASLSDILDTAKFSNGFQAPHSGGLGVWYDTKATAPVKKEETDFIATTPLPPSPFPPPKASLFSKVSKLVQSMPTDSLNDLTEEKKGLPIRHGLLRANSRIRMLTTHRDAHVYIFPRWVLDFVKENDRLVSIAEDVVGWWAKAGWHSGLAEKLRFKSVCGDRHAADENESVPESTSSQNDSINDERTGETTSEDQNRSGLGKDVSTSSADFQVPPILAYVHSNSSENSGPLIRRVDTAQLLLTISLYLAKLPPVEETGPENASPFAHARKVAYPEGVKTRTTITKQDSLIAENVTIEEKTSIKETVVGANCQINEGAKLSQCLLMEGVVVGNGCKLTKCILGKRCVIGDGSVLTDCEVQENLMVEPRSEFFPTTTSLFLCS